MSFLPVTLAECLRAWLGDAGTLSMSPATPTSITPPSGWPSSPACWKKPVTAWPCCHSRTGIPARTFSALAARASAFSSPPGSSIRWSTTTPWRKSPATATYIPPAARRACARTAPPSSTPTASVRRTAMCRSCSAAWRRRCAASPTTTTGTTACAIPASWTRARTCCCSAWAKGPSSAPPNGWRRAVPLPTCAFPAPA